MAMFASDVGLPASRWEHIARSSRSFLKALLLNQHVLIALKSTRTRFVEPSTCNLLLLQSSFLVLNVIPARDPGTKKKYSKNLLQCN